MDYQVLRGSTSDKEAMLEVLEHYNMHHVPSVEVEEMVAEDYLVAKIGLKIVGLAGWKVLDSGEGKTTLMAVLPEYNGGGIGKDLQHRRMKILYELGCKTITTNADRPETIVWYKKHFGYKEIGKLKKLCSFGMESIKYWTTMKSDLIRYFDTYDERLLYRKEYMSRNDAYPLTPILPYLSMFV